MQNLQLTITSLQVAKMVNKRHSDLLRDIETYTKYLLQSNERKIALVDFFRKSQYKDNKGEFRTCYNITKKGCELIAHKMTGQKGVLFTAEYINRFHEMEQQLSAAGHGAQGQVARCQGGNNYNNDDQGNSRPPALCIGQDPLSLLIFHIFNTPMR